MTTVWNDGRSGVMGQTAGNLALSHLEESVGVEFEKLKGTIFVGGELVCIGRACGTDSYLGASVLHWANVSQDQQAELETFAAEHGAQLYYLLVAAKDKPAEVHYWLLPAQIVQAVLAAKGRDNPGDTCGIHIVESEGRHMLVDHDVSAHHHVVVLSHEQAGRLSAALSRDEQRSRSVKGRNRRADGGGAAHKKSPTNGDFGTRFEIPLACGNKAVLSVERPVADTDVARLKAWLDIMQDILGSRVKHKTI